MSIVKLLLFSQLKTYVSWIMLKSKINKENSCFSFKNSYFKYLSAYLIRFFRATIHYSNTGGYKCPERKITESKKHGQHDQSVWTGQSYGK